MGKWVYCVKVEGKLEMQLVNCKCSVHGGQRWRWGRKARVMGSAQKMGRKKTKEKRHEHEGVRGKERDKGKRQHSSVCVREMR